MRAPPPATVLKTCEYVTPIEDPSLGGEKTKREAPKRQKVADEAWALRECLGFWVQGIGVQGFWCDCLEGQDWRGGEEGREGGGEGRKKGKTELVQNYPEFPALKKANFQTLTSEIPT